MPVPLAFDEDQSWMTPDAIARHLPSRPLFSSPLTGWGGVTLQHYRHPPGTVDLPPIRDNNLVVNLAGETLIEETRDGQRREQRWTDSGHMSLTPAGQPISRVLKGRPDVLLIHIEPKLLQAVAASVYDLPAGGVRLTPRLAVPDGTVGRLGRLLLDEAEQQAAGTALVVDLLARSLVVHLLRHHSNFASLPPEPPAPRLGARLRRVLDHMDEHMEEDLPLAGLAALSGLSQTQFSRAFREATGHPPHHYLIELRVQRAKRLLVDTDMSVLQVGMQSGFEQPNHFATTFRRLVGMSPRSWRTNSR